MAIYVVLIITFILLGILSLFKGIKEGLIASVIGGVATVSIGFIHFIISKVNIFFGKYNITMKDFFTWLLTIALGMLIFVVLSFIIKINSKSNNSMSAGHRRRRK
ncbi:hypothetical protein [Clostridium massiliamazoniense]|uniref:hypothetical protein n=1 Tax=Clostridium massiliamazoniense TaxID=1347366 RepID=UPI0006D76D39|nr:hypothetical protein [Clostridium massiliamazoniense]